MCGSIFITPYGAGKNRINQNCTNALNIAATIPVATTRSPHTMTPSNDPRLIAINRGGGTYAPSLARALALPWYLMRVATYSASQWA